jgi:hypothetical protein
MTDLSAAAKENNPHPGSPVTREMEAKALLREAANSFLLKLDALLDTVNRMTLILLKSDKRASDDLAAYVERLGAGREGGTISLSFGVARI